MQNRFCQLKLLKTIHPINNCKLFWQSLFCAFKVTGSRRFFKLDNFLNFEIDDFFYFLWSNGLQTKLMVNLYTLFCYLSCKIDFFLKGLQLSYLILCIFTKFSNGFLLFFIIWAVKRIFFLIFQQLFCSILCSFKN